LNPIATGRFAWLQARKEAMDRVGPRLNADANAGQRMKTVAVLILVAFCTSGCMRYIISEPLPGVFPIEIAVEDLPNAVRSALNQHAPGVEVVKALAWQFKRKITHYEVTVRDPKGEQAYDVSPDGSHCRLMQQEPPPRP
jgi:hypothetical protein